MTHLRSQILRSKLEPTRLNNIWSVLKKLFDSIKLLEFTSRLLEWLVSRTITETETWNWKWSYENRVSVTESLPFSFTFFFFFIPKKRRIRAGELNDYNDFCNLYLFVTQAPYVSLILWWVLRKVFLGGDGKALKLGKGWKTLADSLLKPES